MIAFATGILYSLRDVKLGVRGGIAAGGEIQPGPEQEAQISLAKIAYLQLLLY